MNRPWMPLYIADYLADTAHLNAAQSGAYLHFIMHYWQTGALPADDQALARIARMTIGEWRKARPIIAAFFTDGWRHKRIDRELAHAAEVSSKRRASAEQRHSKSDAIAPANAEQLDTHARATSPSQSQSQTESIPADAGSPSAGPYVFESGVIRLKQKDFDQWKQAYTHLDLAAELLSLSDWASTQKRWFPAVSGALAKRNREIDLRLKKQNSPQKPFDWRDALA